MDKIKLYIGLHNGTERIFAAFKYNSELNKIVRTIAGVKWSQSKKQWHF